MDGGPIGHAAPVGYRASTAEHRKKLYCKSRHSPLKHLADKHSIIKGDTESAIKCKAPTFPNPVAERTVAHRQTNLADARHNAMTDRDLESRQ